MPNRTHGGEPSRDMGKCRPLLRASVFLLRPPAQTPPPGARRRPSPQTRPGGSPPPLTVGSTIRRQEASMPHQSITKQVGDEAEASRPIQQQRLKFHASPIKDTCSSNPSSTPSKCRGPSEEASHRHVPQARTLYWLASSSRASFKTFHSQQSTRK